MYISPVAMTKEGMVTPNVATPITSMSCQRPLFKAASAPMGTAARLLRLSCSAQGDRAVVSLVLALGEETVEMEVTV